MRPWQAPKTRLLERLINNNLQACLDSGMHDDWQAQCVLWRFCSSLQGMKVCLRALAVYLSCSFDVSAVMHPGCESLVPDVLAAGTGMLAVTLAGVGLLTIYGSLHC